MSNPAISQPVPADFTTYEIANSNGALVNLSLTVTMTPSSFTVRFPIAAAPTVQVTLQRGAVTLDLLPGPITDPPLGGGTATFANRKIVAGTEDVGEQRIITCDIQAITAPAVDPDWIVKISGLGGAACAFSQPDNFAFGSTIPLLMCDPIAEFTIGGEATGGTDARAREKTAVRLEAAEAVSARTIVKAPSMPDPRVTYKWSVATHVRELRTQERIANFFAPAVEAETAINLVLNTRLEVSGPTAGGFLEGTSVRPLRVQPLEHEIEIGEERFLMPRNGENGSPFIGLDSAGRIVVAWTNNRTVNSSVRQEILASRLNSYDPMAGFSDPPLRVMSSFAGSPKLASLAGNEWLLMFVAVRENLPTITAFKRSAFERLDSATVCEIADWGAVTSAHIASVISGNGIAIFLMNESLGGDRKHVVYRRYRLGDDVWIDSDLQELSVDSLPNWLTDSAFDASGHLWIAAMAMPRVGDVVFQLVAFRLSPSSGSIDCQVRFDAPYGPAARIVSTPNGEIALFWKERSRGLLTSSFRDGAWSAPQRIPNTELIEELVAAVADSKGGIWLFFNDPAPGAPDSRVMRRAPDGTWGQSHFISSGCPARAALITPNDTLWVVCSRYHVGPPRSQDLIVRRILTSV